MHRVVTNGSTDAIISGQAVTTPFGRQFHRSSASSSTTTPIPALAWVDIRNGFNTRPSGYDTIAISMDVFVPHVQSNDFSYYGINAYGGAGDIPLYSVILQPAGRSLFLNTGDGLAGYAGVQRLAFAFDRWFRLTLTANLATSRFGSMERRSARSRPIIRA